MRYFRFIAPKFSRFHKILNPQIPNFNSHAYQHSKTLASSNSNQFQLFRKYNTASPEQKQPPPERVLAIAEEISGLTLLEVSDLSEVLRDKLGVKEMPTMVVMMPGMGFGDLRVAAAKGGSGAAKGEEKAEKTVFDVKLEGFDAAAKIKVIKEVRSFTDLGLKEAKDLVEKAPTLLKKGVTKEEAEAIIAKMKEVGAKVSME
ncbi:Ribosomal protein [Parasponia andersonii]|uniref:Ribosomal protein n=1 Tax=Parasponia andersonii TaxID=3476 RepID=A0A2P5DDX7_PARAD|nr:Ribosomal protein [Parasponia andersonii]